MMRTKTKKAIEFVSWSMGRTEVDSFEEQKLVEIERNVFEKYPKAKSSHLSHVVSSDVVASLTVSLYLKCATFKDTPSYRQQLTMLYDFRQLLHGKREPKYFTGLRDTGYRQYRDICMLLDELEGYQKTGVVNDSFFRVLSVDKENCPVAHIEEQLTYSREVTLLIIDEMTQMIRDQIYRFFPSQGPKFVKDILKENPYDGIAHVEVEHEETAITDAKKVTFA